MGLANTSFCTASGVINSGKMHLMSNSLKSFNRIIRFLIGCYIFAGGISLSFIARLSKLECERIIAHAAQGQCQITTKTVLGFGSTKTFPIESFQGATVEQTIKQNVATHQIMLIFADQEIPLSPRRSRFRPTEQMQEIHGFIANQSQINLEIVIDDRNPVSFISIILFIGLGSRTVISSLLDGNPIIIDRDSVIVDLQKQGDTL
jgi:hypothetical protein